MIILSDIQKQSILKYVEDKTYFNRLCFVIGVIVSIVCFILCVNSSKDSEVFLDYAMFCLIGIVICVSTFKHILKFRNVRYHLDNNSFIVSKKIPQNISVDKTVQETSYKDNNYTYQKPNDFNVLIQKYYIIDKYNNKYECIKYLDFKKCIQNGEFISVDFPTGERFALYE